MAVPRGKHTKARRNNSRMHIWLKKPALVACSKCGQSKRPHTVCLSCGYYRDREVVDVLAKLDKKEKKKKEKEMKAKEKEGTEQKGPKKSLGWKELSKR